VRTLLQLVLMVFLSTTVIAQWANVPPPQIPRTPDGTEANVSDGPGEGGGGAGGTAAGSGAAIAGAAQ